MVEPTFLASLLEQAISAKSTPAEIFERRTWGPRTDADSLGLPKRAARTHEVLTLRQDLDSAAREYDLAPLKGALIALTDRFPDLGSQLQSAYGTFGGRSRSVSYTERRPNRYVVDIFVTDLDPQSLDRLGRILSALRPRSRFAAARWMPDPSSATDRAPPEIHEPPSPWLLDLLEAKCNQSSKATADDPVTVLVFGGTAEVEILRAVDGDTQNVITHLFESQSGVQGRIRVSGLTAAGARIVGDRRLQIETKKGHVAGAPPRHVQVIWLGTLHGITVPGPDGQAVQRVNASLAEEASRAAARGRKALHEFVVQTLDAMEQAPLMWGSPWPDWVTDRLRENEPVRFAGVDVAERERRRWERTQSRRTGYADPKDLEKDRRREFERVKPRTFKK